MYETVKTVNGHDIYRMKGTQRCYYVRVSNNATCRFKTIKAAAAYCESL